MPCIQYAINKSDPVYIFSPPSKDGTFIFGQLTKNLENACIKARRHKLSATRLIVFLRRQDFRDNGIEMKLASPSIYPSVLVGPLREGFDCIYSTQHLYRQTGVVLAGLISENKVQYTLFDDTVRIEKMVRVYNAVDRLSEKFGKHSVQLASSLPAKLQAQHEGDRGDAPKRIMELFKGENKRQRLGMPVLQIKV